MLNRSAIDNFFTLVNLKLYFCLQSKQYVNVGWRLNHRLKEKLGQINCICYLFKFVTFRDTYNHIFQVIVSFYLFQTDLCCLCKDLTLTFHDLYCCLLGADLQSDDKHA